MPRKVTREVRERALRWLADHQADYPSRTAAIEAVAKQLRLGRETVRRWVAQSGIDAGTRPGVTPAAQAEIKRLKAENRRLREDVEILHAATTFFAGELDSCDR